MLSLEESLGIGLSTRLKTQSFYKEKARALATPGILLAMRNIEFQDNHIEAILHGTDWKEKLDWIVANYRTVLRPIGISQSSAAKILKGAEWEEKVKWIEDNYANSGINQTTLFKAMNKKDWRGQILYRN